MTAYTKSTNFATKDTLTSGDPLKIVKGTEINTEFDNIATAVNSKSDTASPTFTGTVTIPILSYAGTTLSAAVTGTGKMVLDTSPTLSTPALGTPSALVGTNITGTAAGLTAGNVTTNANLTGAVTSVGNAASLGSFTSSQLLTALTDETGTGSAVFATSPTLVTPALGTPASGVLTNCTGVQYTGFKNRIINGQMTTDQRNAGSSQTITAAAALAYTVDRWYGYCTGANVTGQQVAGANATQFRYRFTGAASVTAVGFGQRIEQKNSYDLAGSTATLSADLAISATLTTVTWTAYYATTTADTFGSLASPTVTSIATGTFTVTSTVTNFSTNISIPAAATTGIQILFTVGALTAGLTWTIGNVQLEKSSTATSFDYRPYGTELALCQRYFTKSWPTATAVGGSAANGYFGISVGTATTAQLVTSIQFPVEMRANPTVTLYDLVPTANKTFKGASGKSAYTASISTRSAYAGTLDATLAAEMVFLYTADTEL